MEKSIQKNNSYDDLINYFQKLEKSYDEKQNAVISKNISLYEQYTGLTKGEVVDVDIEKEYINLYININTNIYKFQVQKAQEYNTDNKFIQFVNYYNVNLQRPSSLIGLQVSIKNINNNWELYYSKKKSDRLVKIDKIFRFFGYHNLLQERKIPGELFIGLFVLLSVCTTISILLYNFVHYVVPFTIPIIFFVYLIFVLPFILSTINKIKKLNLGSL